MNICVFCSSKANLSQSTFDQALLFAEKLALGGHTLVYGGASRGLMGYFADQVMAKGAKVIGVMPESVFDHEIAHTGLTQLIYTQDMLDRKKKMMELSDAFVVFPGGIGTMDEAIEVITWKTVYHFKKPIVFFNWENFWDPFFVMLKNFEKTGLFYPETMMSFKAVGRIDEIFGEINA